MQQPSCTCCHGKKKSEKKQEYRESTAQYPQGKRNILLIQVPPGSQGSINYSLNRHKVNNPMMHQFCQSNQRLLHLRECKTCQQIISFIFHCIQLQQAKSWLAHFHKSCSKKSLGSHFILDECRGGGKKRMQPFKFQYNQAKSKISRKTGGRKNCFGDVFFGVNAITNMCD